MLRVLRSLWLSVTLIVLASALLLYSDRDHRQRGSRQAATTALPRLAVMQWVSTDLLDCAVAGIVEGLRQQGIEHGRTADIRFLNASGDTATGNTMARELVSGRYDLVLTASTTALQTVAKANAAGRVVHVFGCVTDPYGAGVGITGPRGDQHPPHLVGIGTFQPVARAIRLARMMNPALRRLGVVWNPGESNSEACVAKARAACKELGVELVEANAGTTSEVPEAIRSVLARGVDAVWVGGDMVANASVRAIVASARDGHIPVFTNDPSDTAKGALFGVGASYRQVGMAVAEIAAKILRGASPGSFGVENVVPEVLAINDAALAGLGGWSIPVEVRAQAQAAAARTGRPFRVALVNLVRNPLLDAAEQGVLRGLAEAGLREGTDLTVKRYNAQGEISQLPAMLDAARTDTPDLIVTVTTPALMAAAKRVKDIPVVFTVASDPVVLGLFTAESRPPNITGVHDDPPVDRLLDMARRQHPGLAAVGIVYDPGQPNSLLSVAKLRRACGQQRVVLHEATAATVSELPAAAQAVIQRGAGAILLSADNLVTTGFPAILRAAKTAGISVYATDTGLVGQGAAGAVGDNYEGWGAQSGRLAAKVLAGVRPGDLPIESTRLQEVVEPGTGAAVSPPVAAAPARPWKVRVIRYNDAQFSADTYRGITDGFGKLGLQPGRDLDMRCLNAQGDMATLTSIVTAVQAEQPDVVMPISTPALQAALRQLGRLRIVFATVGDGVQAGAGQSETEHLPNVTGITTRSPFAGMARLIRASVPGVRAVGTLFSPAEISSELYREWFAEALRQEGLDLVAVPVTTSAETAEATTALLRAKIQLVCQISDNTTRPGYARITSRCGEAGLPFFCFDSSGVRDGATLALARDFYATGVEAAAVAVRVLNGAPPNNIPFANTRTEVLVINPSLVKTFGIALSPELQQSAQAVTGETR